MCLLACSSCQQSVAHRCRPQLVSPISLTSASIPFKPFINASDAEQVPAVLSTYTLDKLKNHTEDQSILELLDLLIEYKATETIVSTFLPALLKSQKAKDGWHYLFGNDGLMHQSPVEVFD